MFAVDLVFDVVVLLLVYQVPFVILASLSRLSLLNFAFEIHQRHSIEIHDFVLVIDLLRLEK